MKLAKDFLFAAVGMSRPRGACGLKPNTINLAYSGIAVTPPRGRVD